MWWLAVPVVIGLTKVIYDAVTEDDKVPEQRKTTLELNFDRLRKELCFHPGRKVAILGQPGAGKSSLLYFSLQYIELSFIYKIYESGAIK